MCGITGCVSVKGNALKMAILGIDNLRYRGYDSVGAAAAIGGEILVSKKANIEASELLQLFNGFHHEDCRLAIAHNRWSVSGAAIDKNAHPQCDAAGQFYVVHNGVVENQDYLRDYLKNCGVCQYSSDTDTEVIVNLIAHDTGLHGDDFFSAVNTTMRRLEGDNAILVISKNHPGMMIAAKKGNSPLLLTKINGSLFAVSDVDAVNGLSEKVINFCPMFDGDVCVLQGNDFEIFSHGAKVARRTIKIQSKKMMEKKSGFNMVNEILEQESVIQRIIEDGLVFSLAIGKRKIAALIKEANRFHFIGCGTSYFACQYSSAFFNRFKMKASAHLASEFNLSYIVTDPKDAFIFLSQSGETADILRVINDLEDYKHLFTLGLVNKQYSSLERRTDTCIYLNAGEEVGVASTKAFTAELVNIIQLAVKTLRSKGIITDEMKKLQSGLSNLSFYLRLVLDKADLIKSIALRVASFKNVYFLGKGLNYFAAEEGALKLKEVSYIHAEAYPLGEMKHGPIALIEENFLCVVVAPNDANLNYAKATIDQIQSRGGKVFLITSDSVSGFTNVDFMFKIPDVVDVLSPILSVVVLQLIAYYTALELKRNPDEPRNLAKSVTVL